MTGGWGNDGQTPEGGTEPEEAERCPICLGALGRCVLAMPDSCCHVFCLSCLLRWAELQAVPSCPVDRQPFNVVYKRDAVLGCVTVPVKKRISQSEPEKCGCTDPEASGCLLKNKQGGRWRRPKTERTSEAKVKGLIRKCSDDEPSVLSKKKVRGPLCSWSPAQTGTAMGTITQCIAEPIWVPEEEPSEDDCKQYRRKTQDCPFLPVAVPVPASGNSRQFFHPSEWSSSPFPLRPLSPFSTAASPLGSGHFVFQGRVCAVTCPKGGEKKGTRGTGSKGPSKQTEALTTRRSGRHSRAEEQAPTQDPASSQSHSSDSDTSTNPPTKAGKSTAAAGKRKGKRAAQRKPSAKKKAPARKKASKVVLSSPSGSEEAKEEEEEEEEEELEQQRKEVEEGEQLSDTAVSPQAVQRSSSPTEEEASPEPSACDALKDTEDQPCKDEDDLSEEEKLGKEEEEDVEEEDQKSPSSDVELNTPGLQDQIDQIEDPEKSNSPTSSNSPERPLESPQSGQSGQLGEEDADTMEATADPTEVKSDDEASVEEEKAEASPCPIAEPECCSGSTRCDSPDGNASQKVQGTSESKVSEEDKLHDQKDVTNEKSAASSKEDDLSEDDTEAIPMDCDSPSSERSTNLASDPPKETESTAHESTSQAPEDERNGSRQERESSVGEEKVEERKNGRQRKSRFHSAATTWSPKRESKQDSSRRSRSRSRERNRERQASGSPPSRRSREREAPRTDRSRDRSRERKNRKRSKSRSRSSSRSRSRNRSYRRGSSPERPDSGGQSPRKRDRWTGDGWRAGPGSDSSRRNFPERPARDSGRSENGGFAEVSPSRENPDWVMEKARADTEAKVTSGPRWEDKGWGADRGRGTGRGRGAYGTSNQQGEQAENRWQPRNAFSGTSNNSGSDAYSRFNENRGGRRKEPEMGESMMDRSGWSSASSWAVRRTLPADVQNYYSRRDRGGGAGSGSWSRQEETSTADPPQSEPNAHGEAPPALNVMPPQLNVLHYPMGPRGPPVSLQPPPFGMPPQVPMHLHSSVPLLQVPVTAAQGLPPPPPPPPPMQQGSMTAIQADSRTTQMMSSMAVHGKAPFMPTTTKVGGATTAQAYSMAMPSSTTQHSRAAHPDSSKKEKIHERAVNEVKAAMKPYYQNKDITKDEYKEIVRKAVEKVCHSKSGEVNSGKVANLVKAYVDKYKHARKK
ncbi:protein SCAF11 isoform X3 [Coregonus clupeaformis]|uniref:protein SCAF11 isoform X3 n=1 Tax=Coregonus clupeaformis TaxID=59861 RepID=UPI001E1C498D|nr:protein SCAF11 isoform X3 [Coregonus clupeaformis]